MLAKVWDKESIHALLDNNTSAVVRGLIAIAARQTQEELTSGLTREENGVGFSRHDAPFLTDILRQLHAGRNMTPKQLAVTRNKVKRYWRQLAQIANERAGAKVAPVAAAPEVALDAFDVSVKREADKLIEARNEVLEDISCECENYDLEDVCPACKVKNRRVLTSALEGSWS